ncbi:MAG TPA: cytochrome P460 family protein [Gemmata sp.]|jgi:hypothetical protein|nr:cytochrome P460 family protein [Gemmata sp.]
MKRIILIISCCLGGCSSPPDRASIPSTSPASTHSHERKSLNLNYQDWPKVTEKPFPVALGQWWDCRLPSPEWIQQQKDLEKQNGPHAKSFIVVHVNPMGLTQFKAGEPVPVGTVVVKEKLLFASPDPDRSPAAIAAMIKREPGYDPDHGDWEYAYEQLKPENERKLERGKIESCIECHKGTKSTDYLFRPYLKTPTK